MITYLTQQLHIPLAKAATTLTNFSGTASLTPLLGAFIADAYIGRFWTIAVASVLYQIVSILRYTHIYFSKLSIKDFIYLILTFLEGDDKLDNICGATAVQTTTMR